MLRSSTSGFSTAGLVGEERAHVVDRERRASYPQAGEIFDPRYVSVEPIEERDAKAFVQLEHYSGTYRIVVTLRGMTARVLQFDRPLLAVLSLTV